MMKKIHLSQDGFGVVELLLILVIIAALGFSGWYTWHSRTNKPATSNKASTSSSMATTHSTSSGTPSTLSKYDDDYVSFSYPSDWKVEKQYTFADSYGAYSLDITAPVDNSLKAADSSSTNLYLHLSILIAKNNHFGAGSMNCLADCMVYHADKVSPKSPASTGSLVVSDWGSQGYPQVVEYSRSGAAVGTKTYELGLAVNSSYYARIYGSYMSGDLSNVKLAGNTDFQNSKAYTQLKELIPTLVFKTSKLP